MDPACTATPRSRKAQSSHPLYRQFTMAAIDKLVLCDVTAQLVKRKNWAAQEPGVITVFAIVGAVAIGLLALVIYKWSMKKKAAKQQF
ncbi:hypothetical protein N3K66_004592 [Trichothecium roseum]|uniref:Uncharacterized protein n=1 Tax=Trichothecium roseum TaxID=47278 RepID=A0ACC0V1Q6_9HYPO|nr:hypothetical protein N3K66_004592 [Trichothecium roseum]